MFFIFLLFTISLVLFFLSTPFHPYHLLVRLTYYPFYSHHHPGRLTRLSFTPLLSDLPLHVLALSTTAFRRCLFPELDGFGL
jgi:hypothetical protein